MNHTGRIRPEKSGARVALTTGHRGRHLARRHRHDRLYRERRPVAVTKRVRYEILKRDSYTCQYCHSTDQPLTVDHIVPLALGGGDDPSNLQAACKDCNTGKSSTHPDDPTIAAADERAVVWADAMATAAYYRHIDNQLIEEGISHFDREWKRWGYEHNGERVHLDRPGNWESSIAQLLSAGLEPEDFRPLIRSAMGRGVRDEFSYFCGCAWNVVKDQQDHARTIISNRERLARGE
jgi:hypothetical protein